MRKIHRITDRLTGIYFIVGGTTITGGRILEINRVEKGYDIVGLSNHDDEDRPDPNENVDAFDKWNEEHKTSLSTIDDLEESNHLIIDYEPSWPIEKEVR